MIIAGSRQHLLKGQELQEFVLGAAADGSGEGVAIGVHHCVEGLGGRAELPELPGCGTPYPQSCRPHRGW